MSRIASERGSMAVEIVILVPVLVAVMALVVSFGRYVDTRGHVEAVARDAVRAATLERSLPAATAVAQAIADETAPGDAVCGPVQLWGASEGDPVVFQAGEIITAELSCEVSLDDLGLLGLPGSVTISGASSAPLDELRRVQ